MKLLILILTMLSCITALSFYWTKGINEMNQGYPDYDGKDMFDEDIHDRSNKKQI